VVSIPHRYCKNKTGPTYPTSGPTVSIPHRYCKNLQGITVRELLGIVSIPHRYCKNMLHGVDGLHIDTSFNSS